MRRTALLTATKGGPAPLAVAYGADFSSGTGLMAVWTSPDGTTWTRKTIAGQTTNVASDGDLAAAYSPELDTFVIVGGNRAIVSSIDGGATWVQRQAPVASSGTTTWIEWDTQRKRFVHYQPVAARYSTDGITWTSGNANGINAVATLAAVWSPTAQVLVGHRSNRFATSPDGDVTTWSDGQANNPAAGVGPQTVYGRMHYDPATDKITTVPDSSGLTYSFGSATDLTTAGWSVVTPVIGGVANTTYSIRGIVPSKTPSPVYMIVTGSATQLKSTGTLASGAFVATTGSGTSPRGGTYWRKGDQWLFGSNGAIVTRYAGLNGTAGTTPTVTGASNVANIITNDAAHYALGA